MTDNSCKKLSDQKFLWVSYHLKNYGDRGGCYTAEEDNTPRIQ